MHTDVRSTKQSDEAFNCPHSPQSTRLRIFFKTPGGSAITDRQAPRIVLGLARVGVASAGAVPETRPLPAATQALPHASARVDLSRDGPLPYRLRRRSRPGFDRAASWDPTACSLANSCKGCCVSTETPAGSDDACISSWRPLRPAKEHIQRGGLPPRLEI